MAENKKTEVAVKKIVIDLGRRELVLTTEEAIQLKAALNELFGKVVTEKVVEHHNYHNWFWNYPQPVYVTNPICYQTVGGISSGQISGGITGNTANAGCITYTSNAGTIQCTVNGGVAEVTK